MISDGNWHETRVEAQDIADLCGLPLKTVESFLVVVENVILHSFYEQYRGRDRKSDMDDFSVTLPYLGDLVISVDSKKDSDEKSVSIGYVPRKAFYEKIKGITEGQLSPLTRQIYKELGAMLKENFETSQYHEGVEVDFDE